MDSYVKRLIYKGVYRFTIDKNGEILPTIRSADGFVKQVRLEEMALTPNLTQSLNNLSMHAVMVQILDEIEYVGDAIRGIHIELQKYLLEQGRIFSILLKSINQASIHFNSQNRHPIYWESHCIEGAWRWIVLFNDFL